MPYSAIDEIPVSAYMLTKMEIFNTERTCYEFLKTRDIQKLGGGYPLFKILLAVRREWQDARELLKIYKAKVASVEYNKQTKQVDLQDPSTDLDRQKKFEEVQKLRILNQTKMGSLISRERAKQRSVTLLTAFASKMRYSIKHTAAQVAGLSDARQVEKILTQNYNDVIDMIEREATLISWSDDESNSELGRTQLPSDSGETTSDGSSEETPAASEKQSS
jgi:hypothetical protein